MASSRAAAGLLARRGAYWILGVCVWLGASWVWSADTASAAKAAAVVIPKSEFKAIGRDPFFPERALGEMVTPASTNGIRPQETPALVLKLLGITGSADRPIVLINRTTFTVGETAELPGTGNRKYKVTLVSIQGTAVTVQVEGEDEPRKLQLER